MSASYKTKLDPDVRDVLERSIITDTAVILPGQLTRDLYVRVDKVLKAAGGKWNRSAKSHVFPRDPREVLGLALTNGHIVDERKALQQFFTPADLAIRLVNAISIGPGDTVLEPSAGAGALADAAERAGGIVQCVEIDPHLVKILKEKNYPTIQADFLTLEPNSYLGEFTLPIWYDKIVMNPPFAKEQDIKHVAHAFAFLKPGGKLGAIMSAGVVTNGSKLAQAFRKRIADNHGEITHLDVDAFDEAGTKVRTVMVTMTKR